MPDTSRNSLAARPPSQDALPHPDRLGDALTAGGVVAWALDLRTRRLDLLAGAPDRPARRLEAEEWATLLHADDFPRTLAAWRHSARTGEAFQVECRLRGADGRHRWFLARGMPVRADPSAGRGRVAEWRGTCTDIQLLIEAREQIARSHANLERLAAERTRALGDTARELAAEIRRREEAQAALLQAQKLEVLGQLAGGIAHDFNNVLTAILGNLELAEEHVHDPEAAGLLGGARGAAGRAAHLVRQLLNFSRKSEHEPRVVAPAELLQRTAELLRSAIGVRFACEVAAPDDVWPVIADPHQLEAALLNLALNARDAMPEGGRITLAARNLAAAEVPAGLAAGGYVGLAVRDEGSGMPAEVLARATEAFFTTKPAGHGTGLGLPMVHGFAAGAGGALRLESAPGQGTRAEIVLPRAAVGPSEPDADEADAEEWQAGGKILLVDGDDLVRPVVARFLQEAGFSVIEASSAGAAFALAQAACVPDLLVIDVMLPGEDGCSLAARLRAEMPDLSVLFVTGGILLPPDGESVLRKPFNGDALRRAVADRLRQARRAREAAMAERLAARLTRPALADFHQAWQQARQGDMVPRVEKFLPALNVRPADVFLAEILDGGDAPTFRFVRFGAALAARLGRSPGEAVAAGEVEDVVGPVTETYGRAAETGLPSYDYTRCAFGDGPADVVERLVLPLSRDGRGTSHLAGMVLFGEDGEERGSG